MVLIGAIHLLLERRVKPSEVAVTGITLAPTTVSIEVGKTAKLAATVTPSNATNQTTVYTSSDDTVATVASDGTVTGVKAGETTITATAGGKSATTAVTVTATTE